MDAQCPTCGQFTQLHNLVNELSFSLIELRSRVSMARQWPKRNINWSFFFSFFPTHLQLLDAERRLSYVEECDCKKHCTLSNGTIKADGSEWDIGCSQCKCIGGQVKCDRRPCEQTKCKYPQPPKEEEGECCPYCKSK